MGIGGWIAILVALLVSILLPFVPAGKAGRERARARRLAGHKMNARLLRFNL